MKRLRLGMLAALALLVLLPAVSLGNYWINYDTMANPIYGNYTVGNETPAGNYYAGPWSAYTQGVVGGTPDPAYYHGTLYCLEANVPEPGGSVFHEHVATSINPTGTWTPPGSYATNFGLQWATHIMRQATPIIHAYEITPGSAARGLAQMNRSALQIAIWEALYDGASGYSFNLTGGDFIINGDLQKGTTLYEYTVADVLTAASGFLTTFKGQDAYGKVYHNGQDLLELGEVPEPGSILLVGLGLLAASGLGRRLRRKR